MVSVASSTSVVDYRYDVHNNVNARTVADVATSTSETQTFAYDIGAKAGGYGGLDDIVVILDGTTVERRFLHGPGIDQVLAEETAADGTLWAVTDQLGTARGWLAYNDTTNTTTVANWRTFDSFGNLVAETNTTLDVFIAYTGRWTDEVTGLQNNRARWFDAAAGRWISEDSIGFAAGDVNIARYVGNNATSRVDPSGLEVATAATTGVVVVKAATRVEVIVDGGKVLIDRATATEAAAGGSGLLGGSGLMAIGLRALGVVGAGITGGVLLHEHVTGDLLGPITGPLGGVPTDAYLTIRL